MLDSNSPRIGPRGNPANWLEQPNAGNSFGGSDISQAWADLVLWEEFLNRHQVGSLVELGTWHGGMAIFLALQAAARGIEFVTVDWNLGQVQNRTLIESLGAEVHEQELLGPGAISWFESLAARLAKPMLLFCDNGNKPREVEQFGPFLAPGDYLAVHDWSKEIHAHQIPEHFKLVWPEGWVGSDLTRWFVVKSVEVQQDL